MSQTKSTKIKEVSPCQAVFSGCSGRPALSGGEEKVGMGRRSGRNRGREPSVGT